MEIWVVKIRAEKKRPKNRTGDKYLFDTETDERQEDSGQSENRANVFLHLKRERGSGSERR